MVSNSHLKQLNENKKASSFKKKIKETIKNLLGQSQVSDEHDDLDFGLDFSDFDDNSSNR